MSPNYAALLQALLVTFLWSTSWVLIKIGLKDLPPLLFAGLRYALAALILLPILLRDAATRRQLRSLDRGTWGILVALGLILYALTQGAQFVALAEISAASLSLILSTTPIFVAIVAIPTLGETPTRGQWLGMFAFVAGAVLYLGVTGLPPGERFGWTVGVFGMVANGAAALLGRRVNRDTHLSPLGVTAVSMSCGAAVLLLAGLAGRGLPALDARSCLILLWLAGINTAFAFTLWNRTLRHLTATESSVINNTMLVQIAVLAWIFLGEALTGRQILGLLIAAGGALMVQLRRSARKAPQESGDLGPQHSPPSGLVRDRPVVEDVDEDQRL